MEAIETRRQLLEHATPRPWRWAGWLTPGRDDIPEIWTNGRGGIRVLAFVPRMRFGTVYADDYEPAGIPIRKEVAEKLRDLIAQRTPVHIPVNDQGEEDPEGRYLAYIESGTAMAFQRPDAGAVDEAGSDAAPARWACFRGQTTAEAGRLPYRHDIVGIDHPDAELLVRAANEYETLLNIVEAAIALHERVEMDESIGVCLTSRQESLSLGAAISRLEP